MNTLVLLFSGFVAALFESTFLPRVLPAGWVPDSILLLVLYASFLFPRGNGLVLSFVLGLFADLFSGAPEGFHAVFAMLFFGLSQATQARVFMQGPRAALGLLVVAFLMKALYLAAAFTLFGMPPPTPASMLLSWSTEFAASLLALPFLFIAVSRILGLPGRWPSQPQKSKPA